MPIPAGPSVAAEPYLPPTRGWITVTHVSVTREDNGLGDVTETETTAETTVRFAPRSSGERTDTRAPAVISGAALYTRQALTIGPGDYFVIAVGSPIDGTWQVEGDPGYWGPGIEIAIKRA